MADLYGGKRKKAAAQPSSSVELSGDIGLEEQEEEDMSSFFQTLLHSSNLPPGTVSGGMFLRPDFRMTDGASTQRAINSSSSSSSTLNFSASAEPKDNAANVHHHFGANFEGSEASDMPVNPMPPRSSKRSRAAEVHNLSEKRRRSRINEKLKALQNLIPNSNKTDKASMLDEAIDYLKQLQLQVQMLTVRNGLSLYPGYLPGPLPSLQQPPSGIDFDEGNILLNRKGGADAFAGNQGLMQNAFESSNQNTSSNPVVIPSIANNTNSAISFGLEPAAMNNYGLLNHLASSKDICRDETLSRLQFHATHSGNNSSSGVSS